MTTISQLAAQLGKNKSTVSRHAIRLGVGARRGRDVWLTAIEVRRVASAIARAKPGNPDFSRKTRAKKKTSGRGGVLPGAGRKPGADGPTKLVAVTVPGKLVDSLDSLAESKGWNRSQAVTEAIRGLLSSKKSKG